MAHEKEQFDDLPRSLIEALKAADQPMPLITARVDRNIADRAQAQFSKRRPPARLPRPAWAAIAASLVIAVLIAQFRHATTPDQDPIYADVDRSGRIDIADVLVLARTREPGARSQAELDAFAMRIVSLDPAGDAS